MDIYIHDAQEHEVNKLEIKSITFVACRVRYCFTISVRLSICLWNISSNFVNHPVGAYI